jgi:hypothetical protein
VTATKTATATVSASVTTSSPPTSEPGTTSASETPVAESDDSTGEDDGIGTAGLAALLALAVAAVGGLVFVLRRRSGTDDGSGPPDAAGERGPAS